MNRRSFLKMLGAVIAGAFVPAGLLKKKEQAATGISRGSYWILDNYGMTIDWGGREWEEFRRQTIDQALRNSPDLTKQINDVWVPSKENIEWPQNQYAKEIMESLEIPNAS